jgi:hypothetical protein
MPTTTSASKSATSIRRAGTLIRSPIENRNKDKDKDRVSDGDLLAAEVRDIPIGSLLIVLLFSIGFGTVVRTDNRHDLPRGRVYNRLLAD